MNYKKHESISLKTNPNYDEQWLKEIIIKDTGILGLGQKIEVKHSELIQPKGGRLDLLLEDPNTEPKKRYELELQLGKTDESHIIRTIEYWDFERNKFPNYEHTAVIVAEEITNRFFNVISLFNKSIPIIAIQLNALRVDDHLVLNFTKVLDETTSGFIKYEDETENYKQITSEEFFKKVSKEIVQLVDKYFDLVRGVDPTLSQTFTQNYIGIQKGNRKNNFLVVRPKQNFIKPEVSLSNIDEWADKLSEREIDIVSKDHRSSRILFRLTKKDLENNHALLKDMIKQSYDEWFK